MVKRKRKAKSQYHEPTSVQKPTSPFNNPFGALSEIGAELPSSAPEREEGAPRPPLERESDLLGQCGKLVVQGERKGRAGKTATRISGLPASQLESLAKRLKSDLGCGATREEDDLLLLGALVDRAKRWLEEKGARKVVISGAGLKKASQGAQMVMAVPARVQGPRSWRESTRREDLEQGLTVDIVLKKDQGLGTLTRGVIQDILTKKPIHPRGIKVRLCDGKVGRVRRVIE